MTRRNEAAGDGAANQGPPDFGRAEKLLESARRVHRSVIIACAVTIGLYWPTSPPAAAHCAVISDIEAVQSALAIINDEIQPDENMRWVCVVSAAGETTDIWQEDGQSGAWLHGVNTTAPLEVVLADLQDSGYIGVPNVLFASEQQLGQARFRPRMQAMLLAMERPLDADAIDDVMRRSLTSRAICSGPNRVDIEIRLDIHEACAQIEHRAPDSAQLCLDYFDAPPGADQYFVIHDRKLDAQATVSSSLEDRVAASRGPELRERIQAGRSLGASPLFELVRGRSTETGVLAVKHDWSEKVRVSAKRQNVTIASIPAPDLTVVSLLMLSLLAYFGVTMSEARRLLAIDPAAARRHFDGYDWIGASRNFVASLMTLTSIVLLPFVAVCTGRVGNRLAEKIEEHGTWPNHSWAETCKNLDENWLNNENSGWALGHLEDWALLVVGLLVAVALRGLWAILGHDRLHIKLCRSITRLLSIALRAVGLELAWSELRGRVGSAASPASDVGGAAPEQPEISADSQAPQPITAETEAEPTAPSARNPASLDEPDA